MLAGVFMLICLSGRFHALAASLLAAAAGLGALLAVLHVGPVLFALGGADTANLGALTHYVHGVLGAAGHEASGDGADVGTIPVDADAAGHHLHILLI